MIVCGVEVNERCILNVVSESRDYVDRWVDARLSEIIEKVYTETEFDESGLVGQIAIKRGGEIRNTF
jgi:hypothetical protein